MADGLSGRGWTHFRRGLSRLPDPGRRLGGDPMRRVISPAVRHGRDLAASPPKRAHHPTGIEPSAGPAIQFLPVSRRTGCRPRARTDPPRRRISLSWRPAFGRARWAGGTEGLPEPVQAGGEKAPRRVPWQKKVGE